MKNIKQTIIFLATAFALVLIVTLGASMLPSSKKTSPDYTINNTTNTNTTSANGSNVSTKPTQTTGTPKPSTPTPKPVNTTPSYTLTQVGAHSNSSSCWTIVRSTVYDLTPWIDQHPGGAGAILSMCGIDATADFEDQHGGQRRPENELQGFEIGTYKK
ncbi:cytochrome b5 domain-containing protein [Candidatus Nomurabacteria bacterium]|nr:cytochrome b5 domain-containing protein [Candidatus Nomurabacteria bacterium]